MNKQKTISPILFGSILSSLLCFYFYSDTELYACLVGSLFSAANIVVWHRMGEALVETKNPLLEIFSFVFCKTLIVLLAVVVIFLTNKIFIKKVLLGFFISFFISLLMIVFYYRPKSSKH